MDPATIYSQVREHYSAASQGTSSQYSEAIAKSFGYTEEELANVPDGANLGLSCGNPLAITSLREGETVIDLGSGAGFDIFLASSRIGASGHAIGVDMNDDMLARANQIKQSRGAAADNVSFVKGVITNIPLEAGIADCVISNCVINLVPAAEKPQVFAEMYRLLKPGGRVAVSDILAKKELPEKLKNDLAMYVGCIAGASKVAEYEAWLREAGFNDILIADTHADLNAYLDTAEDGTKKTTECCIPSPAQPATAVSTPAGGGCCKPSALAPAPETSATIGGCCGSTKQATSCCSEVSAVTQTSIQERTDLNEWVGSYKIYAVKS